jgi:hypothetical protein
MSRPEDLPDPARPEPDRPIPDRPNPDRPEPAGELPELAVPESWRAADDTLADGSEPTEWTVPPGSAPWLAGQRYVHGLLRALYSADATAREARVQTLLERIGAERAAPAARRGGRVQFLVAAVVLLAVGLYAVLPEQLPTAAAAVQKAVAHLARDVDQRYRLEMQGEGPNGNDRLRHDFELMTRPGMRLRIAGKLALGTFTLGEFELGCDGEEFWIRSANGLLRRSVPVAQRGELAPGIADFLDVGYLDVHALVRRLPEDFEVAVVGSEAGADGNRVLHLQAERQLSGRQPVLRKAELWCDEATGMVVRIELEAVHPGGARQTLRFVHLGEAEQAVDYRRPW